MARGRKRSGRSLLLNPCISFHHYTEPKIEDTAADVYYKTERKLPDSQVAIPTYHAVIEAKEWVDNYNQK
ncbi:MAG: DUF3787 domain-containing protein [Tissierellia bacterium]|nr:DUF3787 domain-containing protein [Tissierellia bacterium]